MDKIKIALSLNLIFVKSINYILLLNNFIGDSLIKIKFRGESKTISIVIKSLSAITGKRRLNNGAMKVVNFMTCSKVSYSVNAII